MWYKIFLLCNGCRSGGHTGADVDVYKKVHGGNRFGVKNVDGKRVLEFCDVMEVAVANIWFKRKQTSRSHAYMAQYHNKCNWLSTLTRCGRGAVRMKVCCLQ